MLTSFERQSKAISRPRPLDVGLVARVDAIREKVLGGSRANGSLYVEGVTTMNDGVTLMLHGDIDAGSVPPKGRARRPPAAAAAAARH